MNDHNENNWVQYFFSRLNGEKLESLTISGYLGNNHFKMSDESWQVISKWIKEVAINLKRCVVRHIILSKVSLSLLKSALVNNKSLVEVEILNNTFETKANKEST